MARPEDYPGGASQYYSDLHSGDDDRQKQATDHQWANDPAYPRRFQDEPPPTSRPTVSGGSPRPGTSGGTSDKFSEEVLRWRTIPVLIVLYLIFRYTPLVHEAGAYPGTVGRTVWGLALLAVLFIALAICSPTAAKYVAVFVIGMVLLGAIVLLALAFYTGAIGFHHH